MVSGNSAPSVAFGHYLAGNADKDEVALIGEALNDANLTLPDLRARASKDTAKHINVVLFYSSTASNDWASSKEYRLQEL